MSRAPKRKPRVGPGATRMGGFNPDPGADVVIAERQQRAWELRRAGLTFSEIGKQLGVSAMQAHRDTRHLMAMLRGELAEDVQDYITRELARLDRMMVALWPKIQNGEVDAIRAGVRVSERLSKLLGLDAPERHVAAVQVSGSAAAAEVPANVFQMDVQQLQARLGGLLRALQAAPLDAEVIDVGPEPAGDEDPAAAYQRELAARKNGGNGSHG